MLWDAGTPYGTFGTPVLEACLLCLADFRVVFCLVKKCRKRGKRKLANADEDPASLMTDVDASAMEMSVPDQDATTHKSTRGGRQRLRAACAWQKRNSVTAAYSNDAGGEEDDDRLSS